MSTLKKGLAILLAVVMVMSLTMTMSVFAEGEGGSSGGESSGTSASTTGELIITNTKAGETYNLYKVLDVTYSTTTLEQTVEGTTTTNTKENFSYSINSNWQSFFNSLLHPVEAGQEQQVATNQEVWDYIHAMDNNTAAKQAFARKLGEAVSEKPVISVPAAASGNTTTKSGLEFGYYLMVPNADSTNGSVIFSLNTVKPREEISNKTTYPVPEKKSEFILMNRVHSIVLLTQLL